METVDSEILDLEIMETQCLIQIIAVIQVAAAREFVVAQTNVVKV